MNVVLPHRRTAFNSATGFQFTVKTDNAGTSGSTQFEVPTYSAGTYNCHVDWGDGNSDDITTYNDAAWRHTYSIAGTYTITITGQFSEIRFANGGDKLKMISIQTFGDVGWEDMNGAFFGCSNMTLDAGCEEGADHSAVQDWYTAFRGCSSITGAFPLLDTSGATTLRDAWDSCSGITSFPSIDLTNCLSLNGTWTSCSGLTSFPALDTSNVTDFTGTWWNCTGLTSFPVIDVSAGTTFSGTWRNCDNLTSFPNITTFTSASTFLNCWRDCTGLTTFPALDLSNATIFNWAWYNCDGLSTFPLVNVSGGTSFQNTWRLCNFSSVALLDLSSGTDFASAFRQNTALNNLPDFNFAAAVDMDDTFNGCTALTTLTAGMGDTMANVTDMTGLFTGVTLNTADYDDFLVSVESVNSNSTVTLDGGNSTYTSAGAGGTARAALIADHTWTINDGGGV